MCSSTIVLSVINIFNVTMRNGEFHIPTKKTVLKIVVDVFQMMTTSLSKRASSMTNGGLV